jgi:hypothetical protein
VWGWKVHTIQWLNYCEIYFRSTLVRPWKRPSLRVRSSIFSNLVASTMSKQSYRTQDTFQLSNFFCIISALFYWVFVLLIQGAFNKFWNYWNHHHIQPQPEKVNLSGRVPAMVFESPEKYDSNATCCIICVPQDMIGNLSHYLEAHSNIEEQPQFF